METTRRARARHATPGQVPEEDHAALIADVELRAAIAMVAASPALRVLICGMAMKPRLLAALDGAAAAFGVVLERRIRAGGEIDVVVRAR